MAITQQVSCNGCGKQKQAVNRWWMALVQGEVLAVRPWDNEVFEQKGMQHFCGQTCVIQAVNKFMSDLGGK